MKLLRAIGDFLTSVGEFFLPTPTPRALTEINRIDKIMNDVSKHMDEMNASVSKSINQMNRVIAALNGIQSEKVYEEPVIVHESVEEALRCR